MAVFLEELTGRLITGSYLYDVAKTLLSSKPSTYLRVTCASPISDAVLDEHMDSLSNELRSHVINDTVLRALATAAPTIKPLHASFVPLACVAANTRSHILLKVMTYALAVERRSNSQHLLWMLNAQPMCPDTARSLLSVSREFKVRCPVVACAFLIAAQMYVERVVLKHIVVTQYDVDELESMLRQMPTRGTYIQRVEFLDTVPIVNQERLLSQMPRLSHAVAGLAAGVVRGLRPSADAGYLKHLELSSDQHASCDFTYLGTLRSLDKLTLMVDVLVQRPEGLMSTQECRPVYITSLDVAFAPYWLIDWISKYRYSPPHAGVRPELIRCTIGSTTLP